MNDSTNQAQLTDDICRRTAVLILSAERGRDPGYPLDSSLISKWCAELGFPQRIRFFTREQFDQLRLVNLHYARGGTRHELIKKLREIKNDRN
jgi:hypothetical protein